MSSPRFVAMPTPPLCWGRYAIFVPNCVRFAQIFKHKFVEPGFTFKAALKNSWICPIWCLTDFGLKSVIIYILYVLFTGHGSLVLVYCIIRYYANNYLLSQHPHCQDAYRHLNLISFSLQQTASQAAGARMSDLVPSQMPGMSDLVKCGSD